MARILKLTLELFPPSEVRDQYCVEVKQVVRTAPEARVLHFGIKHPMKQSDVDWVREVFGLQLAALIDHTVGVQQRLEL